MHTYIYILCQCHNILFVVCNTFWNQEVWDLHFVFSSFSRMFVYSESFEITYEFCIFSIFTLNAIKILIFIALVLWFTLGSMIILTILSSSPQTWDILPFLWIFFFFFFWFLKWFGNFQCTSLSPLLSLFQNILFFWFSNKCDYPFQISHCQCIETHGFLCVDFDSCNSA